MPHSLFKILLHIVFSTKDRHPFLRDRTLRDEMHKYIGGILNGLECPPVIVGGVEDHVHALCVLSRTCTPADMMKEVKRSSSLWIKTRSPEHAAFAWQNGYGVFSPATLKSRTCADTSRNRNSITRRRRFRMSSGVCWNDTRCRSTNGTCGIERFWIQLFQSCVAK
jgi:putative transposase